MNPESELVSDMALNPDLVSDPKDMNFFLVYKHKLLLFYPRLVNVLDCIVRWHKSFFRVVLFKKRIYIIEIEHFVKKLPNFISLSK
jgi:hypothetical protein